MLNDGRVSIKGVNGGVMGATTRVGLDKFLKVQEAEERVRYELDEGEIIMTPSPTARHNEIRSRIYRALRDFVRMRQFGYVTSETDFLLSPDTVRKPDIAFVARSHYQRLNVDRSPLEGAPALAVEIISPSNLAQDTFKKIHQYLASGSQLVWVVYPMMKMIAVHDGSGSHEVTQGFLEAPQLLPGFKLPLVEIFEEDLLK